MDTGFDFYKLDDLLDQEQRRLRDRVRSYVERDVLPHINSYWERAEFPREMALAIKDLGIVGGTLQGHGCAGLDPLALGLAAELTQMQLLCLQLARLMEADQMSEGMVSLAKYNNARKARRIAQLAQESMGAMGLCSKTMSPVSSRMRNRSTPTRAATRSTCSSPAAKSPGSARSSEPN